MAKKLFPSTYTRKIKNQDVNNVLRYECLGCSLQNDYVDWSTLSSSVTTYKLSKEELKKYLDGEIQLS